MSRNMQKRRISMGTWAFFFLFFFSFFFLFCFCFSIIYLRNLTYCVHIQVTGREGRWKGCMLVNLKELGVRG